MNHPLGPGANLPTTEKLARAIEAELAKRWDTLDEPRRLIINLFAQRAREGWFDDYKSDSATPTSDLVRVASQVGFDDIVERAKNGEFDGTPAEAKEWQESVEGRETFAEFRHLLPPMRKGENEKEDKETQA